MIEIWKDVPSYEGRYQVSNIGNVRSFCRKNAPNLLKPGRSTSGHLTVALGRGNSRCVHELVLLAFVGLAPTKHECRHLNGNPADNRLDNLKWGTRSENIKDKTAHGLGKLKPLDVAHIKKSLIDAPRGTQARLARQFKVAECTILDIKKGRTHV